ncbi:MAG: hypothetical protein ABII00_08435 [Elusimicrobiota bacterium]
MGRKAADALAVLCLAGAAGVFCLPIANPDIFWHLSAGRWMLDHLAFPRADWLSHTMAGAPWADFEWLVQLLWVGVSRAAGETGLWALKVLVFLAAGGILWRTLGLYGAGRAPRALGIFIWAIAGASANDLRPENFSLLFFLGLWHWLEARRLAGSSPAAGAAFRKRAAALAALFALWANLHAGFLYGLILLAIFAAVDAFRRRSWELAALGAAAAAAALANPYGVHVYLVPWEHLTAIGDLTEYIREWQEASILQRWLWPFWTVLAAAYAAVLWRYSRHRDVPFEHVAALAVFSLSATGHIRTAVYFVSVAVPIIAAAAGSFGLAERRPRAHRALVAAGAAAASAFFLFRFLVPLSRLEAFSNVYVPVRTARFLAEQRETLGGRPLFNPWHWGGYLGYRLFPDYRVFVDGRYIFHPLLRPIFEAARAPESYRALMDRFGIEVAVVQRTGQFLRVPVDLRDGGAEQLMRPYFLFFLPRKDWALVHWDDQGLVFVRRSAFGEEWLSAHEYRYFRPDDLTAAYLMVREGFAAYEAVAGEVERYIAGAGEAGEARAARQWLESVAKAAGR